MSKVKLKVELCKGCGLCIANCPKNAISFTGVLGAKGYDTIQVDDELCIACSSCYRVCPDCVIEICE